MKDFRELKRSLRIAQAMRKDGHVVFCCGRVGFNGTSRKYFEMFPK